MTRSDLMMLFALNAVCDDYEALEQISEYATSDALKCGIEVRSSDITDALSAVIRHGLAKAYATVPSERGQQPGFSFLDGWYRYEPIDRQLRPEEMENLHFRITDKGLAVQVMDTEMWPRDDHQKLRAGWSLENVSESMRDLIERAVEFEGHS